MTTCIVNNQLNSFQTVKKSLEPIHPSSPIVISLGRKYFAYSVFKMRFQSRKFLWKFQNRIWIVPVHFQSSNRWFHWLTELSLVPETLHNIDSFGAECRQELGRFLFLKENFWRNFRPVYRSVEHIYFCPARTLLLKACKQRKSELAEQIVIFNHTFSFPWKSWPFRTYMSPTQIQ